MEKDEKYTGSESEGGITSSYEMDDGVRIRVPYSFFGSVYGREEEEAALSAMKQDSLTMGPQVQKFQEEFAAMCGVKLAFAVSNCTTGMHVATQIFDIKEGDEVIVTPNTFIATSLVILKEKAVPVYADIDPMTFNISPEEIEKKITPRTKAVYVVHYGGQMCDMDPIMELAGRHNLFVLEDCAHSPGAEYKGRKAGSIGDMASFSFHSLKNMTTLGEGGMLTSIHPEWEKPAEMLRCMNLGTWPADRENFAFGDISIRKKEGDYWLPSHFDVQDVNGHWGNNYRMNEVQAAVGRAQLKKLDALNSRRIEIGRYITEGIKDVEGITPVYEAPDCGHVYHLYTVCVEEEELGASRDEFMRILYREEGVQGILHYQPTYHFTGLRKLGVYGENECPEAEKFFYRREINLPMHPRLTKEQQDIMVEGIRNAAKKARR